MWLWAPAEGGRRPRGPLTTQAVSWYFSVSRRTAQYCWHRSRCPCSSETCASSSTTWNETRSVEPATERHGTARGWTPRSLMPSSARSASKISLRFLGELALLFSPQYFQPCRAFHCGPSRRWGPGNSHASFSFDSDLTSSGKPSAPQTQGQAPSAEFPSRPDPHAGTGLMVGELLVYLSTDCCLRPGTMSCPSGLQGLE